MSRKYFDGSPYYKAREKLPTPDGVHCIYCGGKLPKGRRTKCSDKCFSKFYEANHPLVWGQIKEKVLKRDKYVCQECGVADVLPRKYENYDKYLERNPKMEVHHIVPIYLGGDEFDMNNCITLCRECHVKTLVRPNWDLSFISERPTTDNRNLCEFSKEVSTNECK